MNVIIFDIWSDRGDKLIGLQKIMNKIIKFDGTRAGNAQKSFIPLAHVIEPISRKNAGMWH